MHERSFWSFCSIFIFDFNCVFLSFFVLISHPEQKDNKPSINTSEYDFPKVIWYVIPTDEIIIKISTLYPVVIFGITSNLILLNILGRNRALQIPTNLLLGNMVLADTLTLIFCPVIFLCRNFFQNYVLGPIGCKMDGYLQGEFISISFLVFSGASRIYRFVFRWKWAQ